MDNNKKNCNEDKLGIGAATGVTVGFLAGLLINVILIPICIAIGVSYDKIKGKRK